MPCKPRKEKGMQTDPPLGKAGTWPSVPSLGAPGFILTNHTFHLQNLETANQTLILQYTRNVTKESKGDRYSKV